MCVQFECVDAIVGAFQFGTLPNTIVPAPHPLLCGGRAQPCYEIPCGEPPQCSRTLWPPKMTTPADVRALVVTPDPSLAACFAAISKELGIVVEASKVPVGVPMELGRDKYEAFLVDFDAVPDATPTLAAVRTSPSNHGAVVFAVATGHGKKELALSHGANFILERPIDARDMRRKLYAAYDVMSEERRRYFRCAAEVPVFVTCPNGSRLTCSTANISANGMSITSAASFGLGEKIEIALELEPGTDLVLAHGSVVWDDKHGKTGVSLRCLTTEHQAHLDSWLDDHFAKLRQHPPASAKDEPAATTSGRS